MPIKKCIVCDKEFMARLSVYKTCGTICRNRLIAAQKEEKHTITQPCIVCGNEFSNTGKQKHRKTCSVECGHVLTAKARENKVARKCKTCGASFESVQSNKSPYCSSKCGYERNDTKRNCEVCGESFRSPPSQMHVRTCSPECGLKIRVHPHDVGATVRTVSASGKIYGRLTNDRANAKNSRRRAVKLQATPIWANDAAILAIYEECQTVNEATGIIHHVDHIVPLISKTVCGLHCESNLEIITGVENMSKGNRTWPDKP